MSIKLNIDFVNEFTNILHNQNKFLLREICSDYGWDFEEMYNNFLKDNKDFEYNHNLDIDIEVPKKLKEWHYQGEVYMIEEYSNNVYKNDKFVGKYFDDQLYTECEET